MRLLLTGAAGFIGFHTALRLAEQGHTILGYDNLNDYYDPKHKHARLAALRKYPTFSFIEGDLGNKAQLRDAWLSFKPDHILHLAAQAGVRYSLENPMAYIDANIYGFQHMIDLARETKPENFVYASSSSVYGSNTETPFTETQDVSNPISLYAATKKSNELVASCYSHLFKLPTTGLRFFTVYGPYARPDMALYKFAMLMTKGKPIEVFNFGNMERDFTYVDDIVSGIESALAKPQLSAVYNLGRGKPVRLLDMIELLEKNLGLKAEKKLLPIQPGDVPVTVSSVEKAHADLGYSPKVDLSLGIERFSKWFKEHTLTFKA